MRLLQIIRWKNLLLIALIQLIIKYYLIPIFNVEPVLTNIQFVFVVLATVLIAIGGYIINDIYDVETDKINKPEKVWLSDSNSIKRSFIVYRTLSIIGVLLGIFVSIIQVKFTHSLLFILPVILLQLYAFKLKKVLIIGNVLVSILVAYSVLILMFFETNILILHNDNSQNLGYVIWVLTIFAFGINLLREIVKDAEDSIGDKVIGAESIPIRFGKRITHLILKGIAIVLMAVIVIICLVIYREQPLLVFYLVFAVVLALLLFVFQLNKVKKIADYSKLSALLKIIMLVGILAVFMIKPI